MFDKNKFKGRIVELGLTIEQVANMLGINTVTLYRKINGGSDFTRTEIQIIRHILRLSSVELENIFFKEELAETQEELARV